MKKMMKDEVFEFYWRRYKRLEKKFRKSTKYVSLNSKNYAVFSTKFLDMFISVCSEIDSILDEYARQNNFKGNNTKNFCGKIQIFRDNEQEHLNHERLDIQEIYGSKPKPIAPFGQLSNSETTDWWHEYNLVKHNRTDMDESGNYNYEKANLKNVLYALGALYIIIHIYFGNELSAKCHKKRYQSKLFTRISDRK